MITAYHASPYVFTFPSYDDLVRNRQNHLNGNLGLWCAFKNNWISGFGQNVYRVVLTDRAVKFDLTVEQLSQYSRTSVNDPQFFSQYRTRKIADGYQYLNIVEHDGSIGMIVVMDFDCIEDFHRINE